MFRSIIFFCVLVPGAVLAADILVPTAALNSDLSSVLSASQSAADGFVDGQGTQLSLTYRAAVPLDMFIAPTVTGTDYNPADLYTVSLPATGGQTVQIDLTALPTWTPAHTAYYVSFLSAGGDTAAEIGEIAIHGGGAGAVITAAFRHAFEPQPYLVSNMHYLRGRRVLDTPVTAVAGVASVALCILILWRKKRIAPVLLTALLCTLVFQLYTGIDSARLAYAHTSEWLRDDTYAQAGDAYTVAADLAALSPGSVTVCFDSVDYAPKLIRYLLAPIPVRVDRIIDADTTHLVVLQATRSDTTDTLQFCDLHGRQPTAVKRYPSGTVIYSLAP
jgi:hypothetical protein